MKSIFATGFICLCSLIFAQTGKYTVNGNLTLASGVSTEIQLVSNATGAGTGWDQVAVTNGNLTLTGPLDIVLNGYTPVNSHKFEIMTYSGTLSGTFSGITWPASMSTWMIDYGVLFPGKVTIYGPQALPVTWLYFDGRASDGGNELSWATSSEINSDYFAVEYSKDGNHFDEIGEVKASGNSSIKKTYNYLHENTSSGYSYYRLKQMDFDGRYDYSAIVSVRREATAMRFFPSPTSGVLHFSAPQSDITVYDVTGKKLIYKPEPSNSIDLSNQPNGVYYFTSAGNDKMHKVILSKE